MPNPPLLILRLEGPLQSWGLRAKWDVRDSGDEPSKSGIIGLIGCALGYKMYDPRLANELEAKLKIGVRVEKSGKPLKDFHTVMGILPTAEGKFKGSKEEPSTIISTRAYLQDAAFLVIISGPADLIERIKNAFLAPKWPVYLGRKSCPPTRPIFDTTTTEYSSIDDALKNYPWSSDTCELIGINPKGQLRCIVEDPDGTAVRTDKILSSPVRMYGSRKVRIINVDFPLKGGPCTSHD